MIYQIEDILNDYKQAYDKVIDEIGKKETDLNFRETAGVFLMLAETCKTYTENCDEDEKLINARNAALALVEFTKNKDGIF